MITSISLSTILITILVILMNIRAPEEDKFSIIEYIFALVFGWIAIGGRKAHIIRFTS